MVHHDPPSFPTAEVCGAGVVAAAAVAGATQTDDTAPILAFVGAILVALITAVTADRRQARALAAEHDRQETALDAERLRQAATLAHDRQLADLADLRKLLDEAATALHTASYARGELKVAIIQWGLKVKTERPDSVKALNDVGRQLDTLAARIAVRLGRDHEAARAFESANNELLQLSRALAHVYGDEPPEERPPLRKELIGAAEDFEEHRQQFEQAATALAGARLLT